MTGPGFDTPHPWLSFGLTAACYYLPYASTAVRRKGLSSRFMNGEAVECDGSGFCADETDLAFLRIDDANFADFTERARPLGMSLDEFAAFSSSLRKAIADDDLAPCSVRLKGSSASFFSGHHKPMVWSENDLLELFRSEQGRFPDSPEFDRCKRALERQWPADRRPSRRPFDSLYRAGIAPEPSDFDVQISSDAAVERARAIVRSLGLEPNDLRVNSDTYDFIRKDLAYRLGSAVQMWIVEQRQVLRRHVSVAYFGTNGPPDRSATKGPLSSHHQPTDWVLFQFEREQ